MKKENRVIKTKGIVIRKTSRKNYWTINLPNGEEWYGGVDTPKLQAFIYHVGHGKSYIQSAKLAGFPFKDK